jgi:hypothetical protein
MRTVPGTLIRLMSYRLPTTTGSTLATVLAWVYCMTVYLDLHISVILYTVNQ